MIAPWMADPEVSSTWGYCPTCEQYYPTVHSEHWTPEGGAGTTANAHTCPVHNKALDQEGISLEMERMFEAMAEAEA